MWSYKWFPHVIKISTLTLLEAQFSIKTHHQTFINLTYELTIHQKKKYKNIKNIKNINKKRGNKIVDSIPFT